jgi:methyl-accepting chemotaxis protein
MLRGFTIGKRIMFLLMFILVSFFIACGSLAFYMVQVEEQSLVEAERVLLDGYKRSLKYSVQTLATGLAAAVKEAKAEGGDTIKALRHTIQPVRYGSKGYYFIYDTQGYNVAHPLRSDFHGKHRIGTKDKLGNPYIRQLVDKAKNGGGFVTYWFNKPGEPEPSPKLAYAELIPGTDYWVATGIYIDDIKAERSRISTKLTAILNRAVRVVGSGVGAGFLLLVLPFTVAIVRSILLPLRKATAKAQEVAAGNLDVVVTARGRDEISLLEKALNRMLGTLNGNIQEIGTKSRLAEEQAEAAQQAAREAEQARLDADLARKEGVHAAVERLEQVVARITESSGEITEQSGDISSGAQVQSDRIAETATAMEQMNATVLEVARSSGEAAEVGTQAQEKARQGADIVQSSVEAMHNVRERTEVLKQNMDRLGEQADAIGAIMTVIEDIADQTNLLALNAAIEAARAGDAGRGFAVVADEVRKLAEKTMGATKEVGNTVQGIQALAKENMTSVDEAVAGLGAAVRLTDSSGDVLEEIVSSVEVSATQIHSIATAAEEQSATSEEINKSIDEINRITSDTSKGAAHTAMAVQTLSEQLSDLRGLIEDLKQE